MENKADDEVELPNVETDHKKEETIQQIKPQKKEEKKVKLENVVVDLISNEKGSEESNSPSTEEGVVKENIKKATENSSPLLIDPPVLRERNGTYISRTRNTSNAVEKKERKVSFDKRNTFEREYTGIFSMFNPDTFKSTQSEIDEDELMLSIKGQKELKIQEEETSGKDHHFEFEKRQVLLTTVILLILVISRVGINLGAQSIENEKFYNNLVQTRYNYTTSNTTDTLYPRNLNSTQVIELKYAMTLSYYPAHILSSTFFFVTGLILVLFVLPFLKERRDQSSFWRLVEKEIFLPTTTFSIVSILGFITYVGFYLSIIYFHIPLIAVFGSLFGIMDNVNQYYFIYFLTKNFKNHRITYAISFWISVDSFDELAGYLLNFLGLNYFTLLEIICVINFLSVIAIISMPFFDLSKHSIFKYKPREKTALEKIQKKKATIFKICNYPSLFLQVPIHLIMFFSMTVGLYSYPLNFSNVLIDGVRLERYIILLTQGISIPVIAGILQFDIDNLEGNIFPGKVSILPKYKFHAFIFSFGVFGSIACNLVLFYVPLDPAYAWFYLVDVLTGITLSMVYAPLMTWPILLLFNYNFPHRTIMYASYILFPLSFFGFSKVLNQYVLYLNPIGFLVDFYLFMSIIFLIALTILICYFSTSIFNYCLKAFSVKRINQIDTLKPEEEQPEKKEKIISKLWLLFYFPLECLVFLFGILFFFVASGIVNLVLHFGFSKSITSGLGNAFILPLLFLFTIISMYFAYPEELRRLIGALLFGKSRKILGWSKNSTIGMKVYTNPEFSIAKEQLAANSTLWESLHTKNIKPKIALFVVPDYVVLEKESERVKVYEYDSKKDYSMFSYENCANGKLLVNEKDNKKINLFKYFEKNYDGYRKKKYQGRFLNFNIFEDNFNFLIIFAYCTFFFIPILYNVISKFICPTCPIDIFDDPIRIIILIIDFIFGIILVVPFFGIWNEISDILEEIVDFIVIFKGITNKMFKFKDNKEYESLELLTIKNWDTQFSHLQLYTKSKGEFVKYIFIMALFIAKVASALFSLFALFVKGFITQEIIQIVYFVVIVELSVGRYVLQPATITTTEFKLTMLESVVAHKNYSKNLTNPENNVNRSKQVLDKMKTVNDYWSKVNHHWEVQTKVNETGFSVRSSSIRTRWYLTSAQMRDWILSFLFTVIPSLITFFVKQIYA